MSRRSDREERIAQKAADVTTANLMEALALGGSSSYTPSGSLSYFQIFGTSYARIYRTQSAFRSVVDFLSRNIGSIHMKLYEDQGEAGNIPRDHVSIRILDHPQPGVPYSRLMRQVVGDKAIYDVAAVWKIRENFDPTPNPATRRVTNSGAVRHLVRIPVPFISLTQASMTAPLTFELRAGVPVDIPADDIVWMPGYSPESNVAGVPPVETLRQLLAEEWAAAKDRENNWKQGPQEHVVFVQDKDTPGLDADGAREFKTSWRNKYGGVNASNAREWPLLPAGITPQSIAFDAASAEYLATRQLTREECCRAFGIAPELLGVRPSNFASLDMFHQMLYQDTLSPWCVGIQEEFEEQYLSEWFNSSNERFFLDFNIAAKLSGSFAEQAKIGQQAVGGPWMLADEFRDKMFGMPPLKNGEGSKLITPSNVVKGGGPQANPQDAANQFTKKEIDGVLRIASGGEQP